MPIIIRKGFSFANPLAAVFCMMIFLCTAPIAGAEPGVAQAEGAPAEKAQGPEASGAVGRNETRARIPKKKIAIAQFDVANTQHVDDINNIYDGLPSALSGRLEASGEFLSTYTGRSIPVEPGVPQREAIVEIAGETGAQFLISGMVVNAGISQAKRSLNTPFGWSPNIPLSGYTKRHIEVELSVYDGFTGNRLLLRRLDEQASGDVMVGNYKPFGSSLFFETEFGKATNRLLDSAVKDIRAALENVPFSAHIVRVGEKRVFLDAGSDSLLKPGDIFVVYVRDPGTPIAGLEGPVPGVTARAVDTVTLTRVQPQYSIGELSEDAAKLGIRVGNIVRIDPGEQRNLVAKQMEARLAKEDAERVKAQQAAQAEAARVKAEQAVQAEAERIKAEKKAQAQAAAEAKAAKLKAMQEARTARISAAQEARAREQAQAKARGAAEDRAARLKAKQEAKAEAARIKAEKKAQAEAAPKSDKTKATQKSQAGMEVRAVAIEDLERAAAEAEAGAAKAEAEAAASVPPENKKPGVPLKLKQIKP
ncbi:MAG: flagella assembly protein FlgT middle domain-containing protein [Gallionella sp.]|nr:flagella assembly protein FlgT middle domain-containing protein [Gallionella sp.]